MSYGARIFSGGHGQPCIADQRLHWVLCGLRSGNPFWFTVSLGTARDIMPVGSGWPGSE